MAGWALPLTHSLEDWTHSITGWKCEKTKDGYIQLNFNTANWNLGGEINTALESRYPSVGTFNCPDG